VAPKNTKNDAVAPKKNQKNIEINASSVRELAEILRDTELTEIEYETEFGRIRVAKELTVAPMQMSQPVANAAPAPSASAPLAQQQEVASSGAPDWSTHPGLIKAPMVGTSYLAPQPGASKFVEEGASVAEGDTLMIIEAMKVMNPIKAPKSGVVKAVIIGDAEPVEFGQPLIVIES
tara:strand:- start:29370 stop:29900 length:531 start_codon:yes stop_codon:yes gene_type:complete